MYLIILSSSAANDPHVEREKEGVPFDKKQVPVESTDFSKFCLQFLTNYLFNSVLTTSRTIENNFNMHEGFGFNKIILK